MERRVVLTGTFRRLKPRSAGEASMAWPGGGPGFLREGPGFLREGDVLRIEIDGLGAIRRLAAAAGPATTLIEGIAA